MCPRKKVVPRKKGIKPEQGSLPFRNWGGARKGSGKKLTAEKASVPHRPRPALSPHHPVHVTLRLAEGLPSLRQRKEIQVFRAVLVRMSEHLGFRVVLYSVQSNHIHLMIEIDAAEAFAKGMRSLLARLVAAYHRLWDCRGSLFPSRYHARDLVTPMEVRHAVLYILNNRYKHGSRTSKTLDPYASGAWFSGWRESFTIEGIDDIPLHVAEPRSWLLKVGWRRHGRIRLDESPRLDLQRRARRGEKR